MVHGLPRSVAPQKAPQKAGVQKKKSASASSRRDMNEEPRRPAGSIVYVADASWRAVLTRADENSGVIKAYTLELLESATQFYTLRWWGRVGGSMTQALVGPMSLADAMKDFRKRFKEKTWTEWANRANYVRPTQQFGPYDYVAGATS